MTTTDDARNCILLSIMEWSGSEIVRHYGAEGPNNLAGRIVDDLLKAGLYFDCHGIVAERLRQMDAEGWTTDHDDKHDDGSIARAAASYALAGAYPTFSEEHRVKDLRHTLISQIWPWEWSWFKPKDRRRDLVRAAALILAELDRLERNAPIERAS